MTLVHGIRNGIKGTGPREAASRLAIQWGEKLATGYAKAGLPPEQIPNCCVAYYADALEDQEAQGETPDLELLHSRERELVWEVIREQGVPQETAQGYASAPLRQALDWLSRSRNGSVDIMARVLSSFSREVHAYLTSPAKRERCQQIVRETIRSANSRVVVAHSLGSVVAYEALHGAPDIDVDLFLTLGSPLGLRGAIFNSLSPSPVGGKGARPEGVKYWVNIADPGDLIATPQRLGDRFPVDVHQEAHIGVLNFHTMGGYLSSGLVASALSPYR